MVGGIVGAYVDGRLQFEQSAIDVSLAQQNSPVETVRRVELGLLLDNLLQFFGGLLPAAGAFIQNRQRITDLDGVGIETQCFGQRFTRLIHEFGILGIAVLEPQRFAGRRIRKRETRLLRSRAPKQPQRIFQVVRVIRTLQIAAPLAALGERLLISSRR